MTSEEWIANIPSEQDRKYAREAVNAALESEREGEVVLKDLAHAMEIAEEVRQGKRPDGDLIFRPTKAKEAGL